MVIYARWKRCASKKYRNTAAQVSMAGATFYCVKSRSNIYPDMATIGQ